jgi:exopolysaccharide biosynthesis polyprenyl glycosylphosphotransferase
MQKRRRFAFTLFVADVAFLFVTVNIIGWLRGTVALAEPMLLPLVGPVALLVLAISLVEGYSRRTDMLSADYATRHMVAVIVAWLATLMLTFVVLADGYELQQSRMVITLGFFAWMPLSLWLRRCYAQRGIVGARTRQIAYLGESAGFAEFTQECARMELAHPLRHIAMHGAQPTSAELAGLIPEDAHELEAIVLRESLRALSDETTQRLTQLAVAGVPTYTLELFQQIYWRKIPLYRLNHIWLFQEGFTIAREPVFQRLKRISDLTLAFFGLLLATPGLLLAALAIKLADGGPVFFRQRRIGWHRRPFSLVKLRTMKVALPGDGADQGSARYTAQDDPRVTPIGRFLRATRLDEFPQLWNVLRGDMSLIGPRAEWDKLVKDYEQAIPCYHFRHLVRPGITGWAQINYPYGANLEDTRRKLEYDLYYIRHFSFSLDAAIILRTIHVMLFGKGGR